jgi:arsenate reductase
MSNKIKRVLILCTGNSARSQMAEGLLRCDGGEAFAVESAGLDPSSVRPEAVEVMRELGIDISSQRSKSLDEFLQQSFDYVITVCDNANQHCPMFAGVARRVHWSIRDPAGTKGDEPTRLQAFREARDELRKLLREFIAAEKRVTG